MSSDKPIPISTNSSFVAPTPQNTPLVPAPLGGGLSKPTVPDITEELEDIDIDDDDDDDEAKTAAIQSTMLGMVQGRLAELIGKTSGYIESLPLPVRKRIEGLKGVQTEYSKLETAYKKEVLELEKKYLSLYNPLFDRRQKIITGEAEPTEAEIKAGEEQSRKDDPEAEPLSQLAKSEDAKKDQDVKGIPDFWLTALRNHLAISEMITERDEEAIRALKDIRMEYLNDKAGYTLHFHFAPNPFFSNTILSKTYIYKDEPDYRGDFVYSHAEGTKVDWKSPEKNLTKEFEVRKQRNKNTHRTRVVRKSRDAPSFFNFFSPPVPPSDDAVENGDMEEDELDELNYGLEMDYQLGEDLKDMVIPRVIDYFTGKALEYDSDFDDDDVHLGEEDDDDEDSDEDESDDGYAPPTKRKRGKGGKGGDNTEPDECKNQ